MHDFLRWRVVKLTVIKIDFTVRDTNKQTNKNYEQTFSLPNLNYKNVYIVRTVRCLWPPTAPHKQTPKRSFHNYVKFVNWLAVKKRETNIFLGGLCCGNWKNFFPAFSAEKWTLFEVLFGSERKKFSQILLGFLKKHNLKKGAIFSQAVLIWSVAHRKEAHEPWQPGNSGKYQLDENPSSWLAMVNFNPYLPPRGVH